MTDHWRIISIDGLPYGWARMSAESRRIIKEICIHENHISMGEGYTSRIVDSDPTNLLREPTEAGFYKIDGDTLRVFRKSTLTAQWYMVDADGRSRIVTWGEISDRVGSSRNFIKI